MNLDHLHLQQHGWELLGQYPVGDPDGVGSWILHQNGEGLLLELPPDEQLVDDAVATVERLGLTMRYVMASHQHGDHLDAAVLNRVRAHPVFAQAVWMPPKPGHQGVRQLILGGESVWLVYAPKHSDSDVVTIFRGVAMTGDIELGTVDSVSREVNRAERIKSLEFLADFEEMHRYSIHTLISAHLNDYRQRIDWRRVVEPAEVTGS